MCCLQFAAEQKQREAAQKEGASLSASLEERKRQVRFSNLKPVLPGIH